MELTALKFASDTTELERAAKVIAGLVTDVSKLDKASRDAAKTEETLAKAAKLNAEANLANAKAQDQRLKSTITADKADQAAAQAVEKKTKATEKATEATEKNVSILQRQKDILEFQTQGFSKGQSSVLAYGKSAGLATAEIEELGKVLETQRKLMGGDPFDKSLSGLKSLQNQYTELKEAVRQYNTDSDLSSKQTRELARDKERLIEKMKVEGASFSEIRQAVRAHNQEYVNLAAQYNKLTAAEEAVVKNRKEVVAATNYVTQADQKMAAALNVSNAALDKGGTDSLVRYESALKKSGLSQDVVTQKLAAYKAQLVQVGAVEEKRRAQNLARALQPQFTDIGVSLYSGQSPLTVLLQQSGQMVDLFKLSGVEAQNLGKVMKEAFTGMLPAIGMVAKGLGSLVVESFMSVGRSVTGLIANMTLLSAASDKVYSYLAKDGPSVAAQRWAQLGNVMAGITATGIGTAVAALVAFSIAAVKASNEQRELTSTLVMQGASLGLTTASAIDMAKSMDLVGVTTSDTIAVISEMAKAGNLGRDSIAMITEAAVNLNKWGGVAIADTVKTFSSIGKDPVEAMIKFAKETGLLTAEQIKLVDNLVKTEGKAAGVAEAMNLMGKAHNDAAQKMQDEAGLLVKVWVGFLDVLGKVKSAIMDVGRSGFTEGDIAKTQAMVNAAAKQLEGYAAAGGTESGGYKQALAQYKDLSAELEKQTRLRDANTKSTVNQTEANAKQAKELEYALKLDDDLDKKLKSLTKKQVTQTEYVNEYITKLREQGKVEGELYEKAKKVAELEWQKANRGAGKQTKKDLETEIDILNKRVGLTSSYNNELDSLQRLRAKGLITEQEYIHDVEELIKLQPFYVEQQKQINAAHDLSNKLLGKSDMLGKDYYKTLEQIQKFQDEGLYSPEKAEQLRKAAFEQTELAKQQLKYVEESTKTYIKYRQESQKSLDNSTLENQRLDARVALLGLTTEEQKQLKIQQQQRNALLAVDLKLTAQIAKLWEDVRQGKIDPILASLSQVDMEKAAAEERKLINKEVAVQYAEDFMAEMQKIKSGITDSIVTALFEGGKAGSKKLRNLIVDQLKKPVTLVVQAAVNLLLGSLMGSVGLGGLASSALGSAGGSLLGSAAGSAAGGMFGNFLGGGSLTGMIGNITAGVTNGISTLFSQGIGSVFSQGTGLMAAGSAGGGLGTLLGGIGLPLLGIGALISGLSRKLKDVGIEGSFGGDTGFEGRKYKFYKGGFLRSDKTTYENLDPEMQKDLGNAFLGMKKSVADMANTLGLGTEALEKFKTNIKVSFWNLKDDEIQAKLQEALATANNELAEQVLGTWETTEKKVKKTVRSTAEEVLAGGEVFKEVEETITESTYKASEYAKEGEKAIDTLTRLATSLSTVNTTFGYLGHTLYEASLAGADLADQLVEAFGGLEAFTAITSSYYDNFYSDNEKQAAMYRDLEKALGDMGLSMPKTKEEFRALIEAQDLTTESGRKNYASLMRLSTTFAEMIGVTDDLAQAEADRATAAREAATQQLRDYLNLQLEAAEGQMNIWQSLFDFLDQEVKKLYGSVSSTAAMQVTEARGIISSVLATGKFPDQQIFEDAVNTVTGSFSGTNYASKVEADRDRLRFAAQLDELRSVAGNELKTAKNTFDLLKLQLASLDEGNLLSRQQLQALFGIDSSIQGLGETITDAIMSNNSTGTRPGGSSGGYRGSAGGWSGGGGPPGGGKYTPSVGRVNYGSQEALESREKFTGWYQGLQQNASFNKDYEVPDWMRMIMLSSSDEMGLYLFFKNNPEVAADFERIMTGGVSQMSTNGSSLIQSDINKMPPEVAEYFRNNPSALLSYEGFGLDPTLARMAYTGGVEQFGINSRDTNVTEWLRTHRWENGRVVESDNTLLFSHVGQDKYPNARWDTTNGTIVDLDGTIYSPDGTILGVANPEQMYALFGLDTDRDIRSRYDVYINSGLSADDLVARMQTEGLTMQDIASAYGATPDQIAEHLRAGGATSIPAYVNGGAYGGGLALVGEEGPELINFKQGGYVHTASQSRQIMSQEGVIEALNTLNNKVEMLEAAARSTAISNNKIAKLLDRITPDGDSMQVKTVAGSVTTTV